MTKKKSILTAAAAVLAVIGLIPVVKADQWNKHTQVTLQEPIIAGNKVLQPGTYVWKLLDSPSNRNIVQIFDKDQKHLETTVMAIPNYRVRPSSDTHFTFYETPAGVPRAVRAWFYPGDNFGQEFPYPKELVAQLTPAKPVPVATNFPPAQPEPETPASTREGEVSGHAVSAPAPEPQVVPAPEQSAQVAAAQEPATLPKTASYGPLLGLIGLFSFGFLGVISLAKVKRPSES